MKINKVTVIIPAYKPDEKLLTTIEGIIAEGFEDIIIVNDGSGREYRKIFEKAEKIPGCTLISYEKNKGKGGALKTAFAYFTENRRDMAGVVTADADGQHLPHDIAAVAEALVKKNKVIIGARDFDDPKVPPRSRFGNKTTSRVFKIFLGMKITDTQTGLRGIPTEYIPAIASAKGDRYEYETNMLFLMNKCKIPFREVKISTVYIEENKSSHFRPVRDSLKIYSLIIKYILSSAAASATDILVFWVLRHFEWLKVPVSASKSFFGSILGSATWPAALIARVISSLVNYFINSKVVFGDKANKKTLAKYYSLVVVIYLISTGTVLCFEKLLGISSALILTVIKMTVDILLFFLSFRIQHKWVFNTKEKKH